ncbi:MAG: DNA mismatch repair protein MutS [Oscillospiraceae bacterium]|nr:DNA mismatch repair protein MutS [Oscillospiraceae bacterium]
MDKSNLTPMLKQYCELKEQHPGYVLFYRLGDFYEMFFEDATEISRELSLTLTARAGTPMCGVPYHSAEGYIQKLIKRGFKVAMCEQIELDDGKINREVTRLITPGTITQDSMLDEGKNNYIMAFYAAQTPDAQRCAGIACGDLSTGALYVSAADNENAIIDQIARFMPAEILFNADFMDFTKTGEFLRTRMTCLAEVADESQFTPDRAYAESRLPQMPEQPVEPHALSALCALLHYIEYTQKTGEVRFTRLEVQGQQGGESRLELGLNARHHLELTETMRTREKRGSLLWVLDRTKTAMGKRRLRQLIVEPYADHLIIIKRLDAVEELTRHAPKLGGLQDSLSGIFDLERLVSRVVYKTANPRDLAALGRACTHIPAVKGILCELSAALFSEIDIGIDCLSDVAALIDNAIIPEPPTIMRDGGYIADGFNVELDRLRGLTGGGETMLGEIEQRERAVTGIKTLKVGYNRVFGYYIEIGKASIDAAPAHYHRKQTLANAERYITEELKRIEEDILSAKEKAIELEGEILGDVKAFIESALDKIHRTARGIAETDVLCSLADVALREGYCRPEITLAQVIDIKESRHPVVEKMLSADSETVFTPNDCLLDSGKNSACRFGVITGPNMSGKSTYMRQIALIIVMAQMGSFVPAKSARIGVTDKIFTRVGASDDLTAGQSTFMIEMLEVAEILQNATPQSFVILDEIGRGTSTFDGVSIAKAVAEHINGKIGCKTLFATHYHELIALAKHNSGIANYSVSVNRRGDDITFLHKIVSGGTDRSYGIEVAKLAGIPDKVITNAKKALAQMEQGSKMQLEEQLFTEEESGGQIDFALLARENTLNRLRVAEPDTMTPLDALAELSELKKMLDG